MRMSTLAVLILGLSGWMMGLPAVVQAGNLAIETINPSDRAAISRVIEAQIEAFRRDDDGAAFSLASPGIRRMFGDAETFMAVVRTGYAAVYRPRRLRFLDLVDYRGHPAQRVYVVGPDGIGVVAHYLMERQADGSWRIDGCILGAGSQAAVQRLMPWRTADMMNEQGEWIT